MVTLKYRFDDTKERNKFFNKMKHANKNKIHPSWDNIMNVTVNIEDDYEEAFRSSISYIDAIEIIDEKDIA